VISGPIPSPGSNATLCIVPPFTDEFIVVLT
jgi:hypothetical protein